MAATIYAHASGAMNSLGSTGPLISADHQEPSSPVFGLGVPAATSRSSFTGLLSGPSVGSAFRPIQSLTMPIQPPEPKHSFQRFSDFSGLQGFSNNSTSSGPMFNLGFNGGTADVDSPHNEVDLNMNSPGGLFTGLMLNADPPVHSNINTIQSPQLSATALLQKAALMGSSSTSAALMKSLGSSSSSGLKFSHYGGIFGGGTSGGGRASSTFQEMYHTINNNAGGSSNYGNGGGMGFSEMNNEYGRVMYNVKNDHDGLEMNDKENDNVAIEPQMSVQSGYCDKLTRDFLGMGRRITSFSGEVEEDHQGNGRRSNSPDSEETTSAEPNPFVRSRRGF